MSDCVVWLHDVGITDVETVGGKNASLGEMIGTLSDKGVCVPGGFATTAYAFNQFLEYNDLTNKINSILADLNPENISQLTKTGATIGQYDQQLKILH